MIINPLIQPNRIEVLAAVLTYLKQKKLKVIEEILRKFDDMPDDFETNIQTRKAEGIDKAGYFVLRMMKWLISARYFERINYYDLIATA